MKGVLSSGRERMVLLSLGIAILGSLPASGIAVLEIVR